MKTMVETLPKCRSVHGKSLIKSIPPWKEFEKSIPPWGKSETAELTRQFCES